MNLPWNLILFYMFAGVLVLAALGVISVRNSVHAALLLVLTFFTSAAYTGLRDTITATAAATRMVAKM